MIIESSDFFSISSDPQSAWSCDTSWYHLERLQLGSRLLVRKSLKPQYLSDKRLRETLRKEYEVGCLVGTDSEFIVSFYQLVDTADECYLTMDYVEGSTLADMVKSHPEYLSQKGNVVRLLIQLLSGLRTMHKNQVVHLDLKPTNIMITRASHDVRIIDLGLCYSDAYQSSMGMTDSFSAPEQQNGSGDVDARADIYSLGLILEWLSAELGERCRWCKSRAFKKLLSRCLFQDRNKRWQNVEEIIEYVQEHTRNRHRSYAIAATFALICVLSIAFFFFERPIIGTDSHVLYGNFSLFKGTCEAVGKTPGDGGDSDWQGNVYVFSEVRHWGMSYEVVSVSDQAFRGDTSFYTIALPPTLKRIGISAFERCTNLISINIPVGVEYIGAKAFYAATGLNQVLLPSTIRIIPEGCFHKCAIESLIIPEGVESIDLDAFAVCPRLKDVHLPQSLTKMGRGVFWRCYSLETLSLPPNLSSIGEYAFMECPNLKQVENHAADPQPVMSIFSDSVQSIRLLVPPTSVEAYQKSRVWNRLTIEPFDYLQSSI